ncbi:hypothetical protein JL722_12801 [Aureococcus anophagefferens]|nr:hypothetical protein JL722_12801 [Aureococcus anophagefferens]
MVGCPPRALLRAALVAALAAPAAPARVALVALWLGDGTMPRYAATTCASLARPGGAAATLVLVVDDADRAGVPASCRGVDHVRIWELGAGGIARGLAAGAASPARGRSPGRGRGAGGKTLAAKPRVVIELKPSGSTPGATSSAPPASTASYADLDVVFGTWSRGSRRATATTSRPTTPWTASGGRAASSAARARRRARRVAAYAASAPRAAPALGPPGAPEPSSGPAAAAWSGSTSRARGRPRALQRPGAARRGARRRRRARLPALAAPGDGTVVEAAMFHFRIWSDRRDGLFGPFRDGAAPAEGGAFAVDEDGFLDAKARKPGFAADVLAGRAWDGGAVPCAANSTLRPAARPVRRGPDAVEAAARALEGVATVAAFDALHGFVHKKLPPAPRNLRAAKQPKFHYDGFGDGARYASLGELACSLRLAAGGPQRPILAAVAPAAASGGAAWAAGAPPRLARADAFRRAGHKNIRHDFNMQAFRREDPEAALVYVHVRRDEAAGGDARAAGDRERKVAAAAAELGTLVAVDKAELRDDPAAAGAAVRAAVLAAAAAPRRETETYATLVYGDGPFAVGAAVLGAPRRADPAADGRRRAALLQQRHDGPAAGPRRVRAYDAASLGAAALRRDAGPGGLCPGHDQPILNHAFPDWVAVDDGGWATATPGRANRDCGANVAGESYHFFLNSAPWCAELPEGCDPADLGTCGAGGPCRGHAAAVRAWWAALDGLPEPARGLCRAALPASAPPACAGGG